MIAWAEETKEISVGDGGARLRLVALVEQLGDVYAGYDMNTRKIETTERARLMEARDDYEKASIVLREIDGSYKISQSLLQDRANALQEKLSQCDARLGRRQSLHIQTAGHYH